ncbi:hypothetical protein ACJZ2D_014095 [Fusarium nematophilum]
MKHEPEIVYMSDLMQGRNKIAPRNEGVSCGELSSRITLVACMYGADQSLRTYRDRKDKYTKCLERELAQARFNETELERQCEQLRAALKNALGLLSRYGENIPSTVSGLVRESAYVSRANSLRTRPAPLSRSASARTQHTAHVLPSPKLISPEFLSGFYPPRPEFQAAPTPESSIYDFPPGAQFGNPRVCELDQVTVGMEFVLKSVIFLPPSSTSRSFGRTLLTLDRIEEPCLGHLHGDPKNPQEASGHTLTTSAQLIAASGDYPSTNLNIPPPVSPSFRDTPGAVLSRLLSLAPDMSSKGEMTPVQAWNHIRCEPHFGGLEVQSIEKLADKLKGAVRGGI